MGKTRVGVLFRESVGKKQSGNQSADLKNLTDRYHAFVKKIRVLVQSIQAHHAALLHVDKTRQLVTKGFSEMAKNTPLFDATGLMPSANRPSNTVCSYSSVHDVVSAKTKSYAEKYKQFVVDYVVEWEQVVTTRISNGLKKAEEMRRELDHYQKKVEALRLSTNQTMAKGKSVKADAAEKLKRNEEKFIQAKQTYNKMATSLCLLLDEVTERNWRDLHPVLLKCVQFDSALSSDESKAMATLDRVANQLKQVGTANGISAQHRLKDLGTLNPELLTTRPGGATGFQIEADLSTPISPASTGGFGSEFGDMAAPPGTVAPQGLGGFPVQVASSGDTRMERSGSFSSNYSAPPALNYDPLSTMNSLQISQSAAPAPTLEDVYSMGATPSYSTHSAPGSGNYGGGFGQQHRASSFNDADSYYSAASASAYSQAPVGAPPPPPMPPPPPPPGGGPSYGGPSYGGYGPPPLPQGMNGGMGGQQMPHMNASTTSPWAMPPAGPPSYGLPPQPPRQTQTQSTNPFAY